LFQEFTNFTHSTVLLYSGHGYVLNVYCFGFLKLHVNSFITVLSILL